MMGQGKSIYLILLCVIVADRSVAGCDLLCSAARNGHTKLARFLLWLGVSPNSANEHSQTAIILAVANNHPDVVRALLAKGVDVNRPWRPEVSLDISPLHAAAHWGCPEAARVLLEHGADPNMVTGRYSKRVPLQEACRKRAFQQIRREGTYYARVEGGAYRLGTRDSIRREYMETARAILERGGSIPATSDEDECLCYELDITLLCEAREGIANSSRPEGPCPALPDV